MLGDFASLDVQNTYRGSDAYDPMKKAQRCQRHWRFLWVCLH
ncbi:hypothetical protein [Piscirickettsia salmonis]|nr:hypothetical protein [Piscirickettsia salmonis]